ncbi:hypothetical protein B0H10DRAFT_1960142 [Mycena sp. CBHHK59/15]|nr:hypothetical protein B0H10DRAFT_1960142 [Mycena sp. CBHHK59/15]
MIFPNIVGGPKTVLVSRKKLKIEKEKTRITHGLPAGSNEVLRLRGGAEEIDYTPWISHVHNFDLDLELRHAATAAYKLMIWCKIQFTIQQEYADEYRHGYRPQAISLTRFTVHSTSSDVLPDRSYSSIGFLVYGQIECAGFSEPSQTAKVVETDTKQKTLGINVVAALNPTGGASYAQSNTVGRMVENTNDRITPKCPVHYNPGHYWRSDSTNYMSFNISYEPMDNLAEPGTKHQMNTEFSIGIHVGDPENPNDPHLPEISSVTRNQTMLWISNHNLKAKGYGVVVLSTYYVPDVTTTTRIFAVEKEVVDLAETRLTRTFGPSVHATASVESRYEGLPATDKSAAKHGAAVALSVGALNLSEPKAKAGLLKRVFKPRTEEPINQITNIRLHEYKARGWDATLNRWRQPIYPTLDKSFHKTTDSLAVWKIVVDITQEAEAVKGKERDTVKIGGKTYGV